MSVIASPVDAAWLQHLPFTTPRPSPYGPADGLFYGVVGVTGDGSGGIVTLQGILSSQRKTDWVYLIQRISPQTRAAPVTGDALVQVATGPLIPGIGTFSQNNPIFSDLANMRTDSALAVSCTELNRQGFLPLLVFGDDQAFGAWTMINVTLTDNENSADSSFSVWGFIYRYQTFFRGVPARFG